MKHRTTSLALAALIFSSTLHAAPPLINYQGRIVVGTTNFEGTGQFKFALVDGGVNQNVTATATALVGAIGSPIFFISVSNGGSGYVTAPAVTITDSTGTGATAVAALTNGVVTSIQATNGGSGYSFQPTVTIAPPPPNIFTTAFWNNAGTVVGIAPATEPATAVSLPVTKGLYSALLGDTNLAGMAAIPTGVFVRPDLRLRVWFDDGVNGSQLLSPDQRLAPAAYLADGSVTAATISEQAITTAKIAAAAITSSKVATGAITADAIAAAAINISHFPGSRSPGQVLGYNGTDIEWITPDTGGTNGGPLEIAAEWVPNEIANIHLTGGRPTIKWSTPTGLFGTGTRSWIAHVGTSRGLEFWTRSQSLGSPPTAWLKQMSVTTDGDISYAGKLEKLDTAEQFAATVRAADFYLGHSTRRGTPGRALVDDKDPNNPAGPRILAVNYGNDWDETHIGGLVTQVKALRITGGADLAEPFQMKEEELEKGSVVVIDDEHPGRLKRSTGAYDTRVAGIISGANGVNPGIALHQEGVIEGGQNVALSGRVYVQAEATDAPIKPGDLLTTSDTPGHAMKVTDHTKSQGAILGKAMSSLSEGTGMVLVLVTLQ